MTVDFSVIFNQIVFPLLGVVLTWAATYALTKVAQAAHFNVSDGQRAVVETAVQNGIAFAEKELAGHEQITVDDKVGAVLQYVLPKVPDALKWLGIDEAHLADVIRARLPQ